MLASQVRDRARALADLENSQAITYIDEVRSVNESYKDIYNELCISDFDYNVKEVYFPTWSSYKDPYNQYAYIIPLPVDFYQLRFVDYMDTSDWRPMTHMNINQRDINPSEPIYRIKNSDLWVLVGSGVSTPSNIKISYYPVPDLITIPDAVKQYNLNLIPSYSVTTTSNWYIPPTTDATLNTYTPDVMLYNYNSTLIAESILNQSTITLLPYNALQIEYYKGNLYYILGSNVYIASYTPGVSTSISPIVFTGGPANPIALNLVNNTIYITSAAECYKATLNGTTSPTFTPFLGAGIKALYPYQMNSTYTVYINVSNQLAITGPGIVTPIILDAGTWSNLTGDGTLLFGSNSAYNIYQLVIDYTNPIVPTLTNILIAADIAYIGGYSTDNRLSVLHYNAIANNAVSAAVDYNLNYPSNALYEIISYQTAVDFKRKYDTNNADLNSRLMHLWSTFTQSMIKQDQYKHERIQNVRNIQSNYNWNR